ncbi:class I SAM-dependent methyltransferase [Ruminococcaceae bacterium OttesenSCG-928-I18]|nr:class I SAM-dependent methyltransferase [Ruminococcaceae bacterium OttesenSCG-928-I18]
MRRESHARPSAAGGEMYRAGRPSPGARLIAAGSLVRKGRPVADIGCDHGKLAVWLVKKGISPKIIAVDKRPLPLSRAKALARQCGVQDCVDCRLGDGLSALGPDEAEEILITGLSGETITDILAAAPWLGEKKVHLVLQPTTRASVLRRWLCEEGFALEEERPVLERGRAYTNLSVYSKGQKMVPTERFCEVGLLPRAGGRAAETLLQNRLVDLRNRLKAPMNAAEKNDLKSLIDEVEACLRLLK